MDNLKSNTQSHFLTKEITGNGVHEGTLEKKIKQYTQTGTYEIPNYKTHMDDERIPPTKKKGVSNSPDKNQSRFYVEPRKSKL